MRKLEAIGYFENTERSAYLCWDINFSVCVSVHQHFLIYHLLSSSLFLIVKAFLSTYFRGMMVSEAVRVCKASSSSLRSFIYFIHVFPSTFSDCVSAG